MSIYVGGEKAKIYRGDYGPAQFYKGDVKIAGYTNGEKVGAQISGVDTYNDALLPTIGGKSEQAVTVLGKNLFDEERILPLQGWVKQNDGSFFVPNNNIPYKKILWENTDGYTGQIAIAIQHRRIEAGSKLTGAFPDIVYTDGSFSGIVDFWGAEWVSSTLTSDNTKTVKQIVWSYGTGIPGTYVKDLLIAKSNTIVPYEPFVPNSPSPDYPSPIRSSENFDVVSCGRNLFDKLIYKGIVTYTADGFTYTNKEMYRMHSTLIPIDFKPNTQYTLSCDAKDSVATGNAIINVDFTDGSFQYIATIRGDALTHYSRTTFPNRTIKSMNISYASSSVATIITINNLQIVEGVVATPYQPYYPATTAHITDPLRSVGDVSDSIEVSEGKVEVVRRCHQYIADGVIKPIFLQVYTSPECAGFVIGAVSSKDTRGLCTHANLNPTIVASQTTVDEAFIFGGNPPEFLNVYFKLKKSRFQGWQESWTNAQKVEAFKQWLIDQKTAGTPVITQYILYEPTRTDITATPLGQALLSMRTQPHYTQVYTNATLPPTIRARIKEMEL